MKLPGVKQVISFVTTALSYAALAATGIEMVSSKIHELPIQLGPKTTVALAAAGLLAGAILHAKDSWLKLTGQLLQPSPTAENDQSQATAQAAGAAGAAASKGPFK